MESNTNTDNTIVLVEDDKRLAQLIANYLQSLGYRVVQVHEGDRAEECIWAEKPLLIILDFMLPGKDGISICRELRPDYTGPILMLTASDDDLTEVSALNEGIDDFLTKPLRPHILEARINALLRRGKYDKDSADTLRCGDLQIYPASRRAEQAGELLDLTDAEFDLLLFLVNNAGKIIPRDELFTALRGIPYDGQDRSIDQRISTLRRKLGDVEAPHQYIQSVRGKGYLLASDS